MESLDHLPAQEQTRAPISIASSSRRYACDRCRNHKLRCNRDLMTSTNAPCQRCRKARVKCTLGPSIRVGLTRERLNNGMVEEGNIRISTPCRDNGLPDSYHDENNLDGSTRAPVSDGQSESQPKSHIVATEAIYQQSTPSTARMDDGTHLSQASVPWLDMISFDQGQGLDFNPSASPLLTHSHQDGAQMLYEPSAFPMTISPSCPSAESLVEPGQAKLPPEDGASREQSFEPYDYQMLHPHQKNHAFTNPALTRGPQDGFSSTTTDSNLSSSELKDACIQELSDLNASLMKELGLIITCKMATSFLFTPSDKAAAGYLFKTLDGSTNENNAVGRMLYGSERFLDILKRFKQLSLIPSSPASSILSQNLVNSSVSPSSHPDGQPSHQDPETRGAERWSQLQACLNAASQPAWTKAPESSGSSAGTIYPSPTADLQKANTPSTLVILSCYTCLLRIYETVFAVIHHVLECSPSPASAADLPRTIRDLHINGFFLESHRSLQIKILIQVSRHMLSSIHAALEDMSADSMFQALRQTVMKEDDGATVKSGSKTEMKTVHDLLEKVENMLQ